MQRFFVNSNNVVDKKVIIQGENINYIANVLRYGIGEKIEILKNDNSNTIFICEIKEITKEKIMCDIIDEIKGEEESDIHINLIQGLPKSDKMEWIIEKGTELGVKEFTPLKLNRCVVKLDYKEENKKVLRWKKIATSAAEQSKRTIIPTVNNIYEMTNIFNLIQNYDIVLIAYEKEQDLYLKEVLKSIEIKSSFKIGIIVGPEGGLEETEVKKIKEVCNAKVVSLGKRILRTETAGMVMVANIMYELS